MYKQQKPLNIYSAILSILLTALVFLIASQVSAQNATTTNQEPITVSTTSENSVLEKTEENVAETQFTTNNPYEQKYLDYSQKISAWENNLNIKIVELSGTTTSNTSLLTEESQSSVSQRINSIVSYLSNTSEKLKDLSNKLGSQQTNITSNNIDIIGQSNSLEMSNKLINLSVSALRNIDVNTEYLINSKNPSQEWLETENHLRMINDILNDTKNLLTETTSSLKDSVNTAENTNLNN